MHQTTFFAATAFQDINSALSRGQCGFRRISFPHDACCRNLELKHGRRGWDHHLNPKPFVLREKSASKIALSSTQVFTAIAATLGCILGFFPQNALAQGHVSLNCIPLIDQGKVNCIPLVDQGTHSISNKDINPRWNTLFMLLSSYSCRFFLRECRSYRGCQVSNAPTSKMLYEPQVSA